MNSPSRVTPIDAHIYRKAQAGVRNRLDDNTSHSTDLPTASLVLPRRRQPQPEHTEQIKWHGVLYRTEPRIACGAHYRIGVGAGTTVAKIDQTSNHDRLVGKGGVDEVEVERRLRDTKSACTRLNSLIDISPHVHPVTGVRN